MGLPEDLVFRAKGQLATTLAGLAMPFAGVELALLELVAGCPPSAVDELLASGPLTGDGMALQVRHEIARLAVEGAVTPHRRSAIHARILASLRAYGIPSRMLRMVFALVARERPVRPARAAE